MQSAELMDLLRRFEAVLQTIPEAKREMFEEIGAAVLGQVRWNIGGTGKVQGWQDSTVGSKSGYVAVRAKADTYDASVSGKRPYAVGYITNAIENGHRQGNGRYVPALGSKLKQEQVPGRGFYAAARRETEPIAKKAAEDFLKKLKEALG